jgi:hypothetical protein
MTQQQLETPVALLIFNRPETTARVLAEIARARPRKLLVVADGPRAEVAGERERCAAARSLVETVDWDCEVITNFSETNVGCRTRVSSGLDWVFSIVEEAIILEDDCVPNRSFFRFCEEMLDRYRSDDRVSMVSGSRLGPMSDASPFSYDFSIYATVWGWATWRRAWANYDVDLRIWPQLRNPRDLNALAGDARIARHWRAAFESAYTGTANTWDYQWMFCSWAQHQLVVVPRCNLVSNIGFGSGATHTEEQGAFATLPLAELDFPLVHPAFMVQNRAADDAIHRVLSDRQWGRRLWRRLGRMLQRPA